MFYCQSKVSCSSWDSLYFGLEGLKDKSKTRIIEDCFAGWACC